MKSIYMATGAGGGQQKPPPPEDGDPVPEAKSSPTEKPKETK